MRKEGKEKEEPLGNGALSLLLEGKSKGGKNGNIHFALPPLYQHIIHLGY